MQENNLPDHPLFIKGYSTVGDWHSSTPDSIDKQGRDTRFGGVKQECGLHTNTWINPEIMVLETNFLLIGNSRLHWAKYSQNKYKFFHTKKDYKVSKDIDINKIIWASVGKSPNFLLNKNNEIKTGCTVHFVNKELDSGNRIVQKSFFIKKNDDETGLKKKTQLLEYKALPEAIIKIFRYI